MPSTRDEATVRALPSSKLVATTGISRSLSPLDTLARRVSDTALRLASEALRSGDRVDAAELLDVASFLWGSTVRNRVAVDA